MLGIAVMGAAMIIYNDYTRRWTPKNHKVLSRTYPFSNMFYQFSKSGSKNALYRCSFFACPENHENS